MEDLQLSLFEMHQLIVALDTYAKNTDDEPSRIGREQLAAKVGEFVAMQRRKQAQMFALRGVFGEEE